MAPILFDRPFDSASDTRDCSGAVSEHTARLLFCRDGQIWQAAVSLLGEAEADLNGPPTRWQWFFKPSIRGRNGS